MSILCESSAFSALRNKLARRGWSAVLYKDYITVYMTLVMEVLLSFWCAVMPYNISSSEFYEPDALMMEEEGAVIVGLLVGLNVIDANLCLKGEDLDSQVKIKA